MSCPTCRKVAGLAVTFGRATALALKTGSIMSPLLGEKRMAICSSCEALDPGPRLCKDCGCYLEIKTPLIAARCPRGKWTS